MYIKDVVHLLGTISELVSFFFIGMISFILNPFDVDYRLLVLFVIVLYISRYAAITGVVSCLKHFTQIDVDHFRNRHVLQIVFVNY